MKKVIAIIVCILLLVTGCSNSSEVAVPNAKAAKEVAQAVFDGMEKDEVTKNFIFDEVSYDSEKEAWVVVFWNDFSKPGPYSTGAIYITIREKDGKVLSVFDGELINGSPA